MSKFKMRRSCITAVLALATTSALHVVAKAQPSMAMGGDGKGQPYTPPMPYREVAEVEADQRVVRIFFSFSCPFCRTFHTPLRQWAKSLPAPWRYEFVPILLADGTGIHEAAGYLAAQKALGPAVARFEDAAYRAIQGEGRSPRAPETWRGIVNAAGGERAGVRGGLGESVAGGGRRASPVDDRIRRGRNANSRYRREVRSDA